MAEVSTPAPESATPASGGRSATEFRDIADALRNRLDLFGKTLAAVATLGTTAVGLSKVGDLFPATGNGWWVVGACLGLAIAAGAAIWVAVRLMLVGKPIFLTADLDTNAELDPDERDAVRPVFAAAAARFGYTSLIGLQERERSLRNAASRTIDPGERARRSALADEAKTEIEQALARGQVVAIRRRATQAVGAPLTWFLYAAVIGGLIMFALGSDKVSSNRKDLVPAAKACGDARKAGATAAELGRAKDVCDSAAQAPETPPQPPSASVARAQLTAKLVATLEACTAFVEVAGDAKSGPLKDADCNPVRTAMSGMSPPTP
jgi:hypothetical protein